MRYGVVEGEPGIFPEPIARLFRSIGGLFGHKKSRAQPSAPPEDTPYTDLDPKRPTEPPATDDPPT